MDIDKFGEVIDGFLKDNHIQMLIDIPEGTLEPEIKDNADMGGVIRFYIMLHALKASFEYLLKDMEGMLDPEKKEDMIDGMLKMVKGELMEE